MQNKPYEFLQWEISGPKGDGTFEDLKLALSTDNPEEYYPVGGEIPDTWNGNSNPLIVAQYLSSSNNSSYGGVEGVILIRKYVEPATGQVFNNTRFDSNYISSTIKNYLDTTYLDNCSESLKSVISPIAVPYYNGSSVVKVDGKWQLMSGIEVLTTQMSGDGVAWDIWKKRTNLNSANDGVNPGRIMKDRDGQVRMWWLRSRPNPSYACIILAEGNVQTTTDVNAAVVGVLPFCFISKN